jgi:hypothetical protein
VDDTAKVLDVGLELSLECPARRRTQKLRRNRLMALAELDQDGFGCRFVAALRSAHQRQQLVGHAAAGGQHERDARLRKGFDDVGYALEAVSIRQAGAPELVDDPLRRSFDFGR